MQILKLCRECVNSSSSLKWSIAVQAFHWTSNNVTCPNEHVMVSCHFTVFLTVESGVRQRVESPVRNLDVIHGLLVGLSCFWSTF